MRLPSILSVVVAACVNVACSAGTTAQGGLATGGAGFMLSTGGAVASGGATNAGGASQTGGVTNAGGSSSTGVLPPGVAAAVLAANQHTCILLTDGLIRC